MASTLEEYYLRQTEEMRECLLALKKIILRTDPEITPERKYQIPFFYYRGKKLAYLWVTRKKLLLGFVTDRCLATSNEGIKPKDSYYSIEINTQEDLPFEQITQTLRDHIGKLNEAGF